MATINIDVESNKADLDALVASANTKITELQGILGQITSFQLKFTVTEIPSTTPSPGLPPPVSDTEGVEGAAV